MAQDRAILTVR